MSQLVSERHAAGSHKFKNFYITICVYIYIYVHMSKRSMGLIDNCPSFHCHFEVLARNSDSSPKHRKGKVPGATSH